MRKLFSLMLVVLGAAALVSCSKDDDDDVLREGEGEITFVTEANFDGIDLQVYTFDEREVITINWGDGIEKKYVSVIGEADDEYGENTYEDYYKIKAKHTYTDNRLNHTVTVRGRIKTFNVCENEVTSIDVTKCPTLIELYCFENWITTLDVSKNTALEKLNCYDNLLTSLDVSKNTVLEYLDCEDNQLTSLDVSKNTALEWLWCGDNQFSASALNQIFNDLPQGKSWIDEDGYKEQSTISMLPNPGSQTCNRSIAENKGWWFYHN